MKTHYTITKSDIGRLTFLTNHGEVHVPGMGRVTEGEVGKRVFYDTRDKNRWEFKPSLETAVEFAIRMENERRERQQVEDFIARWNAAGQPTVFGLLWVLRPPTSAGMTWLYAMSHKVAGHGYSIQFNDEQAATAVYALYYGEDHSSRHMSSFNTLKAAMQCAAQHDFNLPFPNP